jgi:hypothetical protein
MIVDGYIGRVATEESKKPFTGSKAHETRFRASQSEARVTMILEGNLMMSKEVCINIT